MPRNFIVPYLQSLRVCECKCNISFIADFNCDDDDDVSDV